MSTLWEQNRKYGVFIDAGSSGSRVYIYSWKDNQHVMREWKPEELRGKLPTVERGDKDGLKWTTRQEPGISSFANRVHDISEHLEPLLSFAKEVVPEESHTSTPLFLMATAGMRLLPEEQQQDLLSAACQYIHNRTTFTSECDSQVTVIPGSSEGVYGWIAVNYLMGGFDYGKDTFGFLDMGGASAQIAFEPKQKTDHEWANINFKTLDGQSLSYDVFVATFLGYGSNEARRRYLEERVRLLYEENRGANLLNEHHLLPMDDPCLPLNLNLTDTTTSIGLELHGTGDFNQCLSYTHPLLNKNMECPTEPCLLDGVHTPQIDWTESTFVGISEYWYSSHDILGLGGVYDFKEYEKKASDYCEKDWSTKQQLSDNDLYHHQMQCFKSAWMVNVLHEGIEVPRRLTYDVLEQSIESIESKHWNPPFQSVDTINDIQVSWTLGAMLLYVSSQIPQYNQRHYLLEGIIHPSATGGFMILILIASMGCLWLLWLLFSKTYRGGRGGGANGGILGANCEPYECPLIKVYPTKMITGLSRSLARSAATIRHWASKMLGKGVHSYTTVGFSSDSSAPDSVSITIPPTKDISIRHSSQNLPPTVTPNPPKKKWHKRRYSGESHSVLTTDEMYSPLRSNSSHLTARTCNSPSPIQQNVFLNSVGMNRSYFSSPGSSHIKYSPSRLSAIIQEQSDEEEYPVSDGALESPRLKSQLNRAKKGVRENVINERPA
ncbi:hypothetical protein K501DRAFT_244253 [Backusella circina FSU 941]|nr:hypothetical protein K501DRAFT_244253 [Backusella circina FSU 941]